MNKYVNTQMNGNLSFLYTSAYILNMSIADRLDRAMTSAGFKSQMALARASGVPQPTISRILKKKGIPETETLQKLADACRVTFEWLVSGRDNDATPTIKALNQTRETYKADEEIYWPFTLTPEEYRQLDEIQKIAIDETIISMVRRWQKATPVKKTAKK